QEPPAASCGSARIPEVRAAQPAIPEIRSAPPHPGNACGPASNLGSARGPVPESRLGSAPIPEVRAAPPPPVRVSLLRRGDRCALGILSIGLAAAYYSGDSLGWKLFYVTGCLFVAVQNLEDWEEAVFDKSTGKVVLKTFSLYKKLLTLFRAGHDQVVVLLHDVRDVSVEEEKVRYFGKGYMVVLRLATGFSHPLTQSAVMGHRSDVEAIAKLITSFLELHCLESPTELSQSSDSEAGDPGSQS
uniref:Essential for reactive oxygen species protein n=1 Tax=Pongo abelii TaxID=9601 RepID=A0A2J8XZL0_PONAB